MSASSRVLSIVACASLIGAACGSDADDESGSAATGTAGSSAPATAAPAGTDVPGTSATDAPASTAGSGSAPTMRLGWGFPGEEMKYVMIAKPDLFPNAGTCYQPEWQRFNGTAEQVQGMATGTLDGGTVALLTFPRAIDQGVELVLTNALIEETRDGFSVQWTARKGTTLEDLKGKKIATNALGASLDYIVGVHLQEEAGLALNQDYELVEVPFPQMGDALATGLVDLAPLVQPFYGIFSASEAAADFETLFTDVDILDPTPQLQQGFTKSYATAEPEAVKCFVEDVAKAAEFVLDPANRDEVVKITSEVVELPTEALDPYLLQPGRDFTRPVNSAIDVASLQAAWDLFAEAGAIKAEHQVTDFLIDGISITE